MTLALGMSAPRNGIALTRHVIDTAVRDLGLLDADVFEVYRGDKDRDFQSGGYIVRPFCDRPGDARAETNLDGLNEVIGKQMPIVVDTGDPERSRMLLPVKSYNGPLRVVVLDGISADPHLRAYALQMVELYRNQIGLMDSRERDQLTGLMNRQTFADRFELAMQGSQAGKQASLWLGIVDIDHFKAVNDSFGHLFGDEVLLRLAQLMEASFRYTDQLFRFGGEEFVVLVSTPNEDGAATALERFRATVENTVFPRVGRVTVSIGYARCGKGELPTSVIDKADRALYHAKGTGRNRCVDYTELNNAMDDTATGEVDLF